MRKLYKLISIFVAVVMMATVLAACGSAGKTNEGTNTADTTKPSESTAPQPPVELTVLHAAGGTPTFGTGDPVYDSNPIAKKIEQDLNIKLKWEVLTGDGKQQMGLKLASGEYSDIIIKLGPDIFTKMMSDKMIVALDPYIGTVGQNIKKAYGDQTLNFLREADGLIYHLSEGYGNIPAGTNPPGYGFGFQIRKDIYEALGSPKIETTDDIYEILKNIKNDPKLSKSYNGESVWPMGTFKRSWYNMLQALEAMGGSGTSKWIVKDGKVQYWFRAPWAVELVKFYNRVYREGLLDKESFTIDPDAWQKNKVNTGRVASTIGSWYMVADAWGQFKAANVPNAENMYFLNFPAKLPNGDTPQLVGVSSVGGGYTVVTDKCKNPEAAVKLFDYLASPEGNFMAMNGPENTQWEMKDGKPALKPEYLQRWSAGEGDDKFAAETGIGLYRGFVGTDVGRSPWGTYWVLKDDPTLTSRPDFAQRDEALGKYYFDVAPFVGIESGLADDVNMIYSTIDGKLNDAVYAPILANSEAAAIAEWDKFVKAMDEAGAAKVEEAVTANYQKNLEKLGKK